MPQDPSRAFFILNMLQHNFAGKNTLESMHKCGVPSLKKILNTPQAWKYFLKGLFTPFFGLTSLYLANILPNSKFHPPPPKFFGWIRF